MTPARRRTAFTLVELLVVMAIIGILAGLLVPAVQKVRESSNRTRCQNNIKQLAIAMHNYHDSMSCLPPALKSDQTFDKWSAFAYLNPYLEQTNIYNQMDLSVPLYQIDSTSPDGFSVPQGKIPAPGGNPYAVQQVVKLFLCPSDRNMAIEKNRYKEDVWGPTNYAVCVGTGLQGGGATRVTPDGTPDGCFWAGSRTKLTDIRDGTNTTALISESTLGQGEYGYTIARPPQVDVLTAYVAIPFPTLGPLTDANCDAATNINYTDLRGFQWASGEPRCASYNHYYTPNSSTPDCMGIDFDFSDLGWRAARSRHPGGVNMALADGSVRFVGNNITLTTWRALATRIGNEVISDF